MGWWPKLCGRSICWKNRGGRFRARPGGCVFFLGQFRLDGGPGCEPRLACLLMTGHAYVEILDE